MCCGDTFKLCTGRYTEGSRSISATPNCLLYYRETHRNSIGASFIEISLVMSVPSDRTATRFELDFVQLKWFRFPCPCQRIVSTRSRRLIHLSASKEVLSFIAMRAYGVIVGALQDHFHALHAALYLLYLVVIIPSSRTPLSQEFKLPHDIMGMQVESLLTALTSTTCVQSYLTMLTLHRLLKLKWLWLTLGWSLPDRAMHVQ